MNYFNKIIFFIAVSVYINPLNLYADGFGRLFTTLDQRQQLESLRQQQTLEQQEPLVEEIISTVDEQMEEELEPMPSVELKGVIYRKNGKRTAWINDSNTLSGDMEAESINVSSRDIRKDSIRMVPRKGEKPVIVRVGERFDGDKNTVEDKMDDIVIKRVK